MQAYARHVIIDDKLSVLELNDVASPELAVASIMKAFDRSTSVSQFDQSGAFSQDLIL